MDVNLRGIAILNSRYRKRINNKVKLPYSFWTVFFSIFLFSRGYFSIKVALVDILFHIFNFWKYFCLKFICWLITQTKYVLWPPMWMRCSVNFHFPQSKNSVKNCLLKVHILYILIEYQCIAWSDNPFSRKEECLSWLINKSLEKFSRIPNKKHTQNDKT